MQTPHRQQTVAKAKANSASYYPQVNRYLIQNQLGSRQTGAPSWTHHRIQATIHPSLTMSEGAANYHAHTPNTKETINIIMNTPYQFQIKTTTRRLTPPSKIL
jgi:hypothetical protein